MEDAISQARPGQEESRSRRRDEPKMLSEHGDDDVFSDSMGNIINRLMNMSIGLGGLGMLDKTQERETGGALQHPTLTL